MKRIAIYYRVSTDKQDLASQKTAVQKWLDDLPEDRKPKHIREIKDEGISGKTTNRPGYQELMELSYSGKIDTIVVYRLDRFSRHANEAIRTLLNLDEVGVAFISVTQPVLNLGHENPFRRTMLAAFAEIAEIERETIVARVRSGLEAAKKRGVKLGAPKKLSPEMRAQVLDLRREGHSIRAIGRQVGLSAGSVHGVIREAAEGTSIESELPSDP